MSRRNVLGVVIAAALALAGFLAWWAGRSPPDDETLVRALLDDAARAAGERRVSDAVLPLSERFRAEGLDRRGAKQLVAAQVLRGEWVQVSIAGARLAFDGDRAAANVDVLLARAAGQGKALAALAPGEASVHRFALAIEREPDGWRVVTARWRPLGLSEALDGPPPPAPPGAALPAPSGAALSAPPGATLR